jgi:hypothetical protein
LAAAAESVKMQALLNDDGSGRLFVNTGTGEPWTWEDCSPDLTSCGPFGTGREITTAGASPEAVFRVSGNAAAGLAPGVSPVWHGDIASVGAPSVSGVVRANELIVPVAGQWSGGWENEPDFMQLSACAKPTGENCVTLTNSHYVGGCANEAAVLDPAFVGDFLRVTDRRDGPGPHFVLAYAVGSPYGLDMLAQGPRISADIVGRIAPAVGPRTADCGPPPLNSVSISREGVATIECGLGCHVVLMAKVDQLSARVIRQISRKRASPVRLGERPIPLQAPISLRLPRWFSERINHRPIHLTVKINGKRAARRTLRFHQ